MRKREMRGKVVVFGGTSEGRRLAEAFWGSGLLLHICVATEYGAGLLPHGGNVHIHTGRMGAEEMERFLGEEAFDLCLDATHPHAVQVTRNVRAACSHLGLRCIRIQRDGMEAENGMQDEEGTDGWTVYVHTLEEAVEFLEKKAGRILITTGSKELEPYTRLKDYRERCAVRVLPTREAIDKCLSLGFEGRNLIAMQGPFDEEMNLCLLKQMHAAWMVTKESGREGGFPQKVRAAARAGACLVVIGRPEEAQGRAHSLEEIRPKEARPKEARLEETHPAETHPEETCIETMRLAEAIAWVRRAFFGEEKKRVWLIGMGPGAEMALTQEAREALLGCDVIIGAKRLTDVCRRIAARPVFNAYLPQEIGDYIDGQETFRRFAVVYSGDIGFCSGANGLNGRLKEVQVERVCGIASPIWFLDKLGIGWEDVKLESCHGRPLNLLPLLLFHRRVCVLLGGREDVSAFSRQLLECGREDVRITVGERLSYPEERISTGSPGQFAERQFDPLSIALFENPNPQERRMAGIADDAFLRGSRIPMTKREIRVLALSALQLSEESVVYDIGAGSGSVTVEAALWCVKGRVYAIERKAEAEELIRENCRRFGACNVIHVSGTAPEALRELEPPTHVFIGGSGGRLLEIIHEVRKKNRLARFVLTAASLETMAVLPEVWKAYPEYEDMEVVCVNAARGKKLGSYHMMEAANPVSIVSFGGNQ